MTPVNGATNRSPNLVRELRCGDFARQEPGNAHGPKTTGPAVADHETHAIVSGDEAIAQPDAAAELESDLTARHGELLAGHLQRERRIDVLTVGDCREFEACRAVPVEADVGVTEAGRRRGELRDRRQQLGRDQGYDRAGRARAVHDPKRARHHVARRLRRARIGRPFELERER
jgi:hypothetical protein